MNGNAETISEYYRDDRIREALERISMRAAAGAVIAVAGSALLFFQA